MNKKIGKIISVFIPTKIKNDCEIVKTDKIGLKILINNELITLIEKQNKNNINIKKDDTVILKEDKVDEYKLELYKED